MKHGLRDKWDATNEKIFTINAKAMNVVYCSLTAEEFNRVAVCITVHEIWRILEVTHQRNLAS